MKHKFTNVCITVTALLLIAAFAWAAAPTAKISLVAWSPYERVGTTLMTSSGLKVIGVGETWFLKGAASAGTPTYLWTLKTKPAGSAAALTATDTQLVELVPDKEGQYEVTLSVTTTDGTGETTMALVAGKWVGVGGQWGLPVDFAKGQCALCHFDNTQMWAKTGHAMALTNNLDNNPTGHFASYCISCHSVGFNAATTAVNDGWDDVASELGWVFPGTLGAGTWQNIVTNQPRLAHLGNIQCENCHGPGSLHKGNKAGTAVSLEEGVCGRCHEDGHYHIRNTQWANSGHGKSTLEAQAVRTGCDACHSGWAFVRRVDPKAIDNRPVNGFAQISCAVCHDPHSGTLEGQVRILENVTLGDGSVVTYGGKGKLCMQCHHGRRDAVSYASNPANISTHFGPHGSAQADMIDGSNGIHYGMPVAKSGHILTTEDACVTCHMAENPEESSPAHNKLGGHSFSMIYDNGTPDDPSDDIESVEVCAPCHGEIESFEDIPAAHDYDDDGTFESATAEIEGLMEELAELLPPAGPTVLLTKADYDWTGKDEIETARRQLLLKAAFNYYFVEEDLSGGIHNTAYAATLLRRSIASLKYGHIGSGVITSIKDIPHDQGKQVRVTWSKFPADGPGDMPIKQYAVWRRVDEHVDAAALAATGKIYRSFDEVPATLTSEVRVLFEEDLYDYVSMVPAIMMPEYSVVVPTLYDSSKTEGMNWSVYVVTGQTDLPYWYTASAPDSGYSIDNLAPMAPMSLKAAEGAEGVTVSWDAPIDADFKYFTLYRGESATFDPDAEAPVAKLTDNKYVDASVQANKKYYYHVAATDFSGNRGDFSSVIMNVTSVVTNANLPTDFALEQNYPNPFNPSTTISFGLPTQQRVELKIYDLRGQLVRVLASGSFSAGSHKLSWDGRDDMGQLTSAGTYLYRLESEGATITKKMIFLK